MLLGFAGFEDNNRLEIAPIGSTTVVTTSPRTGTYCLRIATYAADLANGWSLPVGKSEFYFQFAIKLSHAISPSTDTVVFTWVDSGGNILGCLRHKTNNTYGVYVGNLTTLVGTTITTVSTSFMVIEGYIKISTDVGRIVIKCNGVTEVDFTGNTQPGAATEVASIRCGNFRYNHVSTYIYFDDIVVNDATGASFNSWPMGIKCHKVAAPLANGNYAQWTPSAGDNFECIDESPPSMDDYVEGAIGQKDSYKFGDAPVGLSGIAGVVVRYYGQGNGDIKRLCRHGGVDYLSDAFTVPGTFNKVDDVMPEKPGGGGWDETVFNACEFGMEHQ